MFVDLRWWSCPESTSQNGVPRLGGGQNPKIIKIHWGITFSPKMMISQGVGHLIPQLGVCYASEPPKGGGGQRVRLRLIKKPI